MAAEVDFVLGCTSVLTLTSATQKLDIVGTYTVKILWEVSSVHVATDSKILKAVASI